MRDRSVDQTSHAGTPPVRSNALLTAAAPCSIIHASHPGHIDGGKRRSDTGLFHRGIDSFDAGRCNIAYTKDNPDEHVHSITIYRMIHRVLSAVNIVAGGGGRSSLMKSIYTNAGRSMRAS